MDDKNRQDDKEEKEKVILNGEEDGQASATSSPNTSVTEENDVVQQELQQARDISKQFENNYKRALADYQNLQRRTQEEKVEWIRMAGKDLLLKFLPVLDTLILAQSHLQDTGLALSIDQFLKALQEEGVTRIETNGKEFDATTMEAITTQEAEKENKGKVTREIRAGFMFGETVLRPAQVEVGK